MRGDGGQAPLRMWGGIECSHVRIGDDLRDECVETGHRARIGDLDLIADTGIAALRYPVLWGDVAASGRADFSWHDARFARLRDLGLRPVAGLLHHGWGPGDLHPLHPRFVEAFADFAEAVARRYPWIEDFTPINEPVTTARFSYLYGHWYPHLRDEGAFLRAVMACAEATAAAMARIRRHIPQARLVQTEDLGRTFFAGDLQRQADHDNARRFLALDLLTGRVDPSHPFHARLRRAGVAGDRLDRLRDAPTPPGLVGIDHYLTSDRFLDDNLGGHPPDTVGGNGRQRYADVAAVHRPDLWPSLGFLPRLREVGVRFGLPMAITEAHVGCSREEQVRWLVQAWQAAQTARAEGMTVEAVTSWAMLGTYDWNSLLLRREGYYESGAFTLGKTGPVRTAVGDAVAALSRAGSLDHPLLADDGWWKGGGRAHWGLGLTLKGPMPLCEVFADCCTSRGIAVNRSALHLRKGRGAGDGQGPGQGPGQGHVDITPGPVRLVLRHPARPGTLVEEVPHPADLPHRAHRLLDRLVDLAMTGR